MDQEHLEISFNDTWEASNVSRTIEPIIQSHYRRRDNNVDYYSRFNHIVSSFTTPELVDSILDPISNNELMLDLYNLVKKNNIKYEKEKFSMFETLENPDMTSLDVVSKLAFVSPVKTQVYNKRFLIIVVGVGGTGGYVVRDLSRYLYSIHKRVPGEYDFKFVVVDPDNVEEKNLLRQNFLPQDLGQNKADTIAARHAKAFQLEIASIDKKLTENELSNITSNYPNHVPVIIGCVDNNEARRQIHQYISNTRKTVIWIDSGNEKTTGQVVMGSSKGFPTVVDLNPEILEATRDTVAEVSCAERLMQGEQNIFVNLTAANHILNFFRMVVQNEATCIHGVRFNISGKVDTLCLTTPAEKETETVGTGKIVLTPNGFQKVG
ncbi:MAG: ThiF family adenylyltransferase [Lachnospiraceae bacterium]|nr:ThiF family adenylyltransferase [Lachnospiraceae bacterium]